jgi:hypothetical protein
MVWIAIEPWFHFFCILYCFDALFTVFVAHLQFCLSFLWSNKLFGVILKYEQMHKIDGYKQILSLLSYIVTNLVRVVFFLRNKSLTYLRRI